MKTEPVAQTVDEPSVDVAVAQVATKPVEPQRYTVRRGDTLAAIADEFYGDPAKYQVLFEANRALLDIHLKKNGDKTCKQIMAFMYG